MTCKDCVHFEVCAYDNATTEYSRLCAFVKPKADFVEVVRCKDCKHGRPIDKTKSPEKYYKDGCVVCECEDVVGDEPMIYLPNHFCSYGERKEKDNVRITD